MTYEIKVLRRASKDDKPYRQSFKYETGDDGATLATALNDINKTLDSDKKIKWECSCLQKKCGACAMVINGTPSLACDYKLAGAKDGIINAEPLKKFPVICDLVVDRGIMFENLKNLGTWLNENADVKGENTAVLYDASRCLQCGCCLEVCPNFYSGGDFFGTASMVPLSRLLSEVNSNQKKELKKNYSSHFFEGCGKSFACRNICPAGIDVDSLFSRSNAVSLWSNLFKHSK